MSDQRPPPLPPRPPRPPRPVEPFRELVTPPQGTPRPIETLADVGAALWQVRRELAALKPPSTPPPSPSSPPPRPSAAARVARASWKGTQWVGVATLVLTLAAQVAALLKPGLAGPLQRAAEALETLAK